jgi:hypothetical protein
MKASEIPVKAKRSKAEKVTESREEEINDKDGLESDFKKRFIGRADIPIKNISVCPEVALPINPFKVSGLSRSILACYDPTQMMRMILVRGMEDNLTERLL